MQDFYTHTYTVANPLISITRWELIVYITLAFIVGYLIHYTFSRRRDYFRTPKKHPGFYYDDSLNTAYYPHSEPIIPQNIQETHIYEYENDPYLPITDNDYELYHQPIISKELPQAPEKAYYSTQDDLKIIEGIGPKIEKILNAANIKTWQQLAKTPVKELKKILEKAGKPFQLHDPSSWPEQAHLADTQQWDRLKELQDYLDGGKYVNA